MSTSSSALTLGNLATDLFTYGESLGHGELHIKMDKESGLHAIVSIHNTNLGPALGGCRFIEYDTVTSAIYDAMRLARGMTYKAAISNLPLGGGKSVIIRPKQLQNREAIFDAFGKFVNDLGGRYITAVDSGTDVDDMDVIHRHTSHVTSTSRADEHHGNPSYSTAVGVFQGIRAAAKLRLGRDDLAGLQVVMQGTGHVGYPLAKMLHDAGAKLTVCDMNAEAAKRCADEFSAKVVDPNQIFNVPCDVFAPCALGAVINDATLPRLQTKIVAGSANNQLAEARHGLTLKENNILYVPDYVINAGGLIEVAVFDVIKRPDELEARVHAIYDTVYEICEQALATHADPAQVADAIAAKRIYGQAFVGEGAVTQPKSQVEILRAV
jgi:leucine dehydrogenase